MSLDYLTGIYLFFKPYMGEWATVPLVAKNCCKKYGNYPPMLQSDILQLRKLQITN